MDPILLFHSVQANVLFRRRSQARFEQPNRPGDRAAESLRKSRATPAVPAGCLARSTEPFGDGSDDGTLLLSTVVRTSWVQRFSSTAAYPTIRGSRAPRSSALAARGLRDTLLPR